MVDGKNLTDEDLIAKQSNLILQRLDLNLLILFKHLH